MNRRPPAVPRVKESTLPGVGKKYVIELEEGGHVAVIVKPDGERQMYHFLEEEDRPCDVLTLESAEAQQVAMLLGTQLIAAPDREELQIALGQLDLEWVKLHEGTPLVGKTLLESQLRKRTGASVVAVLRHGEAIANPPIDTRFEVGDTVVIIGTPEQGEAARRELEGDAD
ncbi:MAG: cation:proton antiporter regulatory subunit [Trueperaceae bacterium]